MYLEHVAAVGPGPDGPVKSHDGGPFDGLRASSQRVDVRVPACHFSRQLLFSNWPLFELKTQNKKLREPINGFHENAQIDRINMTNHQFVVERKIFLTEPNFQNIRAHTERMNVVQKEEEEEEANLMNH